MKRGFALAAWIALAGGVFWILAQVAVPAARPLAELFPAGPALYLEAKDLQSLVNGWNSGKEKQLWLASDNYAVFSRSNLSQKLMRAQGEFASAAGVPPDMALLSNVAGAEAALAVYDIGEMQFLYVTRMPAARFAQSALWKARGSYEPRKSAGLDYYVHSDKPSKRVATFATAQDYLLLATREDLLASALALLAGQKGPALTSEPWYTQSVRAAKTPGELRMVLNMDPLLRSPYMRSYWIQRNATELKQYSAAISDISRAAGELDESRLLFRAVADTASWNENAVAQLTAMAPAGAGLVRAWASPSADEVYALIHDRILEPQPGAGPEKRTAPVAESPDSTVGIEGDLETRIDDPPLDTGGGTAPDSSGFAKIDAMMYAGASRVLPDGVLVGIDSAVVLLRSGNWDLGAARSALAAAGARFDGPSPIAIAANGPVLIIANRPAFLQSLQSGAAPSRAGQPARYAAIYRHGREVANFERLTRLIDNPLRTDGPMFFSQNVASAGRSLMGRLDSASIRVRDTGAVVSQDLVYRLTP